MSCAQISLQEVAAEADAIFAGTVTGIRRLRLDGLWGLCTTGLFNENCGSKIAAVSVARVWKGEPGAETSVFSEDACYCLGSYFTAGEEMLFVLARGEKNSEAVYRTAFCVRSGPVEAAAQDGTLGQLDALLPTR